MHKCEGSEGLKIFYNRQLTASGHRSLISTIKYFCPSLFAIALTNSLTVINTATIIEVYRSIMYIVRLLPCIIIVMRSSTRLRNDDFRRITLSKLAVEKNPKSFVCIRKGYELF